VAIGLLFASMPVAGRILLGSWEFREAAALSVICFAIAAYMSAMGRRRIRAIPDGAEMLDRARRLSRSGNNAKAVFVLTEAIRLDPKLWQAFEYRGQLRAAQGDHFGALEDFNEAIRLAPHEPDLYLMRAQIHTRIGQEELRPSPPPITPAVLPPGS
jgi:Tfp pilus assembly protein PilF